jgi:hypothetical protein
MPSVAFNVPKEPLTKPKKTPAARKETVPDAADLAHRAAVQLDTALRDALPRLRGILLAPERTVVVWPSEPGSGKQTVPAEDAQRLGNGAGCDAAILVAVDRFGVRTAFVREMWLRAVAYVVVARNGEVRGPIYAVGQARTAPRLVRPGFMRPDSDLLSDTVADACARLIRGLDKGDTAPFAADVRVAVLPAAVPARADIADASGRVIGGIEVGAMARQADVLFQPDVGPIAEIVEPARIKTTMAAMQMTSDVLWKAAGPDVQAVSQVGDALRAEYVFVSRARASTLGRFEAEDGAESVGDVAETLADFALVLVSEQRVLWRASCTGTARSHINTPEGTRRIRTREQCVMDSVVSAFSNGRLALEEWLRRSQK